MGYLFSKEPSMPRYLNLLLLTTLLAAQPQQALARSTSLCLEGNCVNGQGLQVNTQNQLYRGGFVQGQYQGQGTWSGSQGEQYIGAFVQGQKSGQGSWAGPKGEFYQGTWSMDKPHGQGVRIEATGEIYAGAWQQGQKQGPGVLYQVDGQLRKGQFQQGQLSQADPSLPTQKFHMLGDPSGEHYLGFVAAQGIPVGYGSLQTKSQLTARGRFEQGKPAGDFLLKGTNGHYLGQFKEQTMHGQGLFYFANGNRYLGEFVNDQMQGRGLLALTNGELYLGAIQQGTPEGQGSVYFPNGDIYTGSFAKGLKHGKGELLQQGRKIALVFEQGKQVSAQPPAPESQAETLRQYRATLGGRRMVLDKQITYSTKRLNAHGGYLELQAGESCEFLALGPVGSSQISMMLTVRDDATQWLSSHPSENFLRQRVNISYSATHALWLRASSVHSTSIPLHVIVSCGS